MKKPWFDTEAKRLARTHGVFIPDAPGEQVFDPALRHFQHAFRNGEPPLSGDVLASTLATREELLLETVRNVSRSDVGKHLVLRGGMTMRLWFGASSRPIKDIDWMVRPDSWAADSDEGRALLDRLIDIVCRTETPSGHTVARSLLRVESIWTYERAEGRRIAVPFGSPTTGELLGVVQHDLVFREPLADPPVSVPLPQCPTTYRSAPEWVWTASPAESLAWKLLWLISDIWPQGKDLYDAVTIAEALPDSARQRALSILAAILSSQGLAKYEFPRGADWLESICSLSEASENLTWEWQHFAAEYPALADAGLESLRTRLAAALSRSVT